MKKRLEIIHCLVIMVVLFCPFSLHLPRLSHSFRIHLPFIHNSNHTLTTLSGHSSPVGSKQRVGTPLRGIGPLAMASVKQEVGGPVVHVDVEDTGAWLQ